MDECGYQSRDISGHEKGRERGKEMKENGKWALFYSNCVKFAKLFKILIENQANLTNLAGMNGL